MFQSNQFVRIKRQGPETLLLQFFLLIALFFVVMIGVIAFMHFSSAQTVASVPSMSGPDITGDAAMVDIIVPINSIETGAALDSSMFRRELRPTLTVGPNVITDVSEIAGLYTRGMLVQGQPVVRDMLSNLQPVNVLTASIPTGYRAIAIRVDATSSVQGWAQPGARVDVIWVTNVTGRRTASVVATNAKVLSANRRTEQSAAAEEEEKPMEEMVPSTVTLLLTKRDSLRVRLAGLHGRLSLVLRGSQDGGGSAGANPINEGSLYSALNRPKAAPPRNIVTVKVKDRDGGSEEKMVFENWERIP